jgi:hypothetical protein
MQGSRTERCVRFQELGGLAGLRFPQSVGYLAKTPPSAAWLACVRRNLGLRTAFLLDNYKVAG